MARSLTSISILVTLALAAGVGCSAQSGSTSGSGADAVDRGSDANGLESNTESLSSSLISGDAQSLRLASASDLTRMPGSLSANDFGAEARGFYRPAGCLNVAGDTAAKWAKYTFNDCTGPYGLVHVTGEVAVTWTSAASNQITVNFSTTGLRLNSATADIHATANVTGNGLARDMVWDGAVSGTTGRGHAFQRTNHKEYKWTAGQACLSVAGTSDGTLLGYEIKTDVINFSICAGGCPQAGSEIRITDVGANAVYDVKWNAGDATYTAPDGRTRTFTPLCAL